MYVRADLIPKIRALAPARPAARPDGRPPRGRRSRRSRADWPGQPGRVAWSVMGHRVVPSRSWPSARRPGGPTRWRTAAHACRRNFPVPIVIVQHMPPLFTAMLAERLSSKSAITVGEAAHGDRLRPGHAWIAPGDYHMIVTRAGGDAARRAAPGPAGELVSARRSTCSSDPWPRPTGRAPWPWS